MYINWLLFHIIHWQSHIIFASNVTVCNFFSWKRLPLFPLFQACLSLSIWPLYLSIWKPIFNPKTIGSSLGQAAMWPPAPSALMRTPGAPERLGERGRAGQGANGSDGGMIGWLDGMHVGDDFLPNGSPLVISHSYRKSQWKSTINGDFP